MAGGETEMNSKVFLKHVDRYDVSLIHDAISEGVNLVGVKKGLSDAKTIAIKPNLAHMSNPLAVVDTSVVEALLKYIREINPSAKIYIVESDSYEKTAESAYAQWGYLPLEKRYDINLVNLTKEPPVYFVIENPAYFNSNQRHTALPKLLDGVDFFITVPKMKTHVNSLISGAIKNQLGCIKNSHKSVYHVHLERVLYDLERWLKPDLCIVDGIHGMAGEGPAAGIRKETNTLIIGNDSVGTDIVMARVMGINPYVVPVIRFILRKERRGPVEIFGKLSDFVQAYEYSWLAYKLNRIALKLLWLSDLNRAIGCDIAKTHQTRIAHKRGHTSHKVRLLERLSHVFERFT